MTRTVIEVKPSVEPHLLRVVNKSTEDDSGNSTVQNTKETPQKKISPAKVKFEQPKVKVVRSKTPLMRRADQSTSAKRSAASYRFLAKRDSLPEKTGNVYKEASQTMPQQS